MRDSDIDVRVGGWLAIGSADPSYEYYKHTLSSLRTSTMASTGPLLPLSHSPASPPVRIAVSPALPFPMVPPAAPPPQTPLPPSVPPTGPPCVPPSPPPSTPPLPPVEAVLGGTLLRTTSEALASTTHTLTITLLNDTSWRPEVSTKGSAAYAALLTGLMFGRPVSSGSTGLTEEFGWNAAMRGATDMVDVTLMRNGSLVADPLGACVPPRGCSMLRLSIPQLADYEISRDEVSSDACRPVPLHSARRATQRARPMRSLQGDLTPASPPQRTRLTGPGDCHRRQSHLPAQRVHRPRRPLPPVAEDRRRGALPPAGGLRRLRLLGGRGQGLQLWLVLV